MHKKKTIFILAVSVAMFFLLFSVASAKKAPSLAKWKASFDPSGAKYRCLVSNLHHPAAKGTYAGFAIRDELWKRTGGKIYFDFKPFGVLGGEVEVLNQLQMGVVQGMAVSSVASTNLGPRFGLVNLPFLVNSSEKLEKFVNSGHLFDHYMRAMEHQGIMGLDITTYGEYGWATTTPVHNIADAKKIKLRIARSAVDRLLFESWGLNAVSMPWSDVQLAMKQGVIDGLVHTVSVCNLQHIFDVAKYYTKIDFSRGLFIWIFNKAWFEKLPDNLQKIFVDVVHEVCAQMRKEAITQDADNIIVAKDTGVEFFTLSKEEMATLQKEGNVVHEKYAPEINELYPSDTYRPKNYLKEVQDFLGYKP